MTQHYTDNQTSTASNSSAICEQQLSGEQLQTGVFTRATGLSPVLITGEDAEIFLQGQATCDVRKVNRDGQGFGAFCDAKGRALCTFRIFPVSAGYIVLMASDLQPVICKRLGMYVLRSRVVIECLDDQLDLIALWGPSTPSRISQVAFPSLRADGSCLAITEAVCAADPVNPDKTCQLVLVPSTMSHELTSDLEKQGLLQVTATQWQLREILGGIPHISQVNSGEYVPQMLNLELLDGVSFEKGCYIGQEVIARMHYLGRPSRRTYLVVFSEMDTPPNPGDKLFTSESQDQQSAGHVLRCVLVRETRCCYVQAVLQTSARHAKQIQIANMPGKTFEFMDLPYTVE